MLEIGQICEVCVTKLIGEQRRVEPKLITPGQTEVPRVGGNRFYCSIDGEGQYIGEVVNEILEIGEVRRAEYRYDKSLLVVRDESLPPHSG